MNWFNQQFDPERVEGGNDETPAEQSSQGRY